MPVSCGRPTGEPHRRFFAIRGSLIGSSAQFCAQMLASLIQYKSYEAGQNTFGTP